MKGKKILSLLLVCAVVLSFAACSQGPAGNGQSAQSGDTASSAVQQTPASQEAGAVKTVELFTNCPDRSIKEGRVEDKCIAEYEKENPNVKIKLEVLEDEPYKQKFKAYAASNDLPDLMMVWAFTSFLAPLVKNGYIATLNPDDYKDYNFLNSSWDNFTFDGKLYGLPRSAEIHVVYYNKKIFADNGLQIPKTFDELVEITKALRAKGIQPCAVNGKDKWEIDVLMDNMFAQMITDKNQTPDVVARKTKFADHPEYLKAAQEFKRLMDAGFYQDSFASADYGTARNLFAQGQTAMYYMGSWEMGMQTDASLSKEFIDNVDCFPFPPYANGPKQITDLDGVCAAGYAVAKNGNSAEAVKFLNYMMKPDKFTKYGWQESGILSAQDVTPFKTGKETPLQLAVLNLFSGATSLSGPPYNQMSASSLTTDAHDLVQTLAAGMISPEDFIKQLDDKADHANELLLSGAAQ